MGPAPPTPGLNMSRSQNTCCDVKEKLLAFIFTLEWMTDKRTYNVCQRDSRRGENSLNKKYLRHK